MYPPLRYMQDTFMVQDTVYNVSCIHYSDTLQFTHKIHSRCMSDTYGIHRDTHEGTFIRISSPTCGRAWMRAWMAPGAPPGALLSWLWCLRRLGCLRCEENTCILICIHTVTPRKRPRYMYLDVFPQMYPKCICDSFGIQVNIQHTCSNITEHLRYI